MKQFSKILIGLGVIVWTVGMVAGFIGRNQEAAIIQERNFVATLEKSNLLEIKSRIYFVSDEENFTYQVSQYTFLISCLLFVVFVYLAKTRKNNSANGIN